MISYDANAVVHINESLTTRQIHDIERDLSRVKGVVSACVHVKTPHLMVVDYDPRTMQAGQLVRHFRRNGLHASLIGGI